MSRTKALLDPKNVLLEFGPAPSEDDALAAAGASSFHLDGKHDQDSHGRDKPDKAKSKNASDFKKTADAKKSKAGTGKPLKITHMLVHKAHGEPGTVLTENGASDKRVVWDGAEYRLQRKTDDGKWTTEKKVKKSKAYAEVNAYDSDWRVPAQGGR